MRFGEPPQHEVKGQILIRRCLHPACCVACECNQACIHMLSVVFVEETEQYAIFPQAALKEWHI